MNRKVQVSQVPGFSFKATANSGDSPVFSITRDLEQLGQPTRLHIPGSLLFLGSILLLTGIGYMSRRRLQHGFSQVNHWLRTRPPRKTYGLRPLNPGHEKDFQE